MCAGDVCLLSAYQGQLNSHIAGSGRCVTEAACISLWRDTKLTFWRRNYFFNFSTPYIENINNTGTKYVTIMTQTAF